MFVPTTTTFYDIFRKYFLLPPHGLYFRIAEVKLQNDLGGLQPHPQSQGVLSANRLIYNDLHGNQCNNFHNPYFLNFL